VAFPIMLWLHNDGRSKKIFENSGALLEGHFLLTSGRHSPIYWEKFHVLQNPFYTQKLCHLISQHYQNQGAQVVVGPTTGGIIIAYEVARQLGIRSLFADRGSEGREFRPGSGLDPGTKTLIVDDILTNWKISQGGYPACRTLRRGHNRHRSSG